MTANQHGPCGGGALRSPTWTGPRTSVGRRGGRRMSLHRRRGLPGGAVHPVRLAVLGHHRHRDHSGAPGSARGLRIVAPGPVSAPATSCLGAGLAAPGGGQRDGLLERVPAAQAGPGAWRSADVCRSVLPGRAGRGCRPYWREHMSQGCVMRPAGIRARFTGWPMPGSDRGLARQILEGGPMRWTGRA